MYQAFYNLLVLIENEIINPIFTALRNTRVFDSLILFIKNIINSFFRLFQNDNIEIVTYPDSLYSITAEIIGIVFIIIVLKVVFKLFNIAFTTINDNFKRRIK